MIEVKDKEDCCGCSACINICPKQCIGWEMDVEGFRYPKVHEEECVHCDKCLDVCPVSFYDNITKVGSPEIYAAKSKEQENLLSSSSGGIFMELARVILEKKGVVYGVKFDSDYKVVYGRATTWETCVEFRGSKYVQADIMSSYMSVKKDLECGLNVLFSGTPCQIAGLKLYLGKEYEKLYTIDLICHGVASPLVFHDYIAYVEQKHGKIQKYGMRHKLAKGDRTIYYILFRNGKEIINCNDATLWSKIFYSYLVMRPSCHACKFTHFNRSGDITLGDFWGIEVEHPEFSNADGVSLVFANTIKGKALFDSIVGRLDSMESSKEHCICSMLYESTHPAPLREIFWKDYHRRSFVSVLWKYFHYVDYSSHGWKTYFKKIYLKYKKN